MAFVIKAEVPDVLKKTLQFAAQKTMYGGKNIAKGDHVFIFASGSEGGRGLMARRIVSSAEPVTKKAYVVRQTPRLTVTVTCIEAAKPFGRSELRLFSNWKDGQVPSRSL